MKGKLIIGLLILALIAVPLFAVACEEEEPPPAQQEEEEEEEQPPAEEEEEEEGDWWDKLGEPQYGGTLTFRGLWEPPSFDQALPLGTENALLWLDTLFVPDWTLDRDIWAYNIQWIPDDYLVGHLVESWEMTDPLTVTLKLREGVKFQDKPPVNGRELTAEDVQYTYDRLMGTGSGFTEANPYWASATSNIERVVATGKYTVEFRLKSAAAMLMSQVTSAESFGIAGIIPHEWVEQCNTQDWTTVVGTGPFMLTDFQPDTSLTYSKNPDYWGYDERHPENQLPYVDTFKYVKIPDESTMLAAMRTSQIDFTGTGRGAAISVTSVESIENTNPEIVVVGQPGVAYALAIRCDVEPFTDIRVRRALQMSLDRETIVQAIYGGRFEVQVSGIAPPFYTGWVTPYDQWPAELQAEYGYNPDGARELLAEAAADGVFVPNSLGGFDTELLTSPADNMELNEVMQGYFLDIGVDMEIKVMDNPGTVRSMALAGEHKGLVAGGKMGFPMAPSFIATLFDSRNESQNYCRHNDAYYNGLVDQFLAATDLDEAKQLYNQLDDYWITQHWVVAISLQESYSLWQPRVKGTMGEYLGLHWGFYPARFWVVD